jgi:son of sevenless-like protein
MSYQNSTTYDFLSLDNEPKWKALLCPALRKIQKQVHPRLEIDDDALEYLEVLIFHLMSQMCSAHPHSITDVESHVQSTFAHPIDVWSLSEAQEKMERYAVRKRGVFLFPIEKLYHLLVKEVFGYKVDITVVQFIMAILDYVAADILKVL